ncbi:hypothetical protein BWQ96_01229 [Gracilariopsis chorda]|uniref:Uncharacterized protein n=1 Tax=Gracilariopsis chorda TaxID=448386 RepID=A0A2V3J3R4_9FLOR|nr:hypothetical protein BWQ96_01229 [Gracilariopsis chorda]|eukprot:PXF49091.1 hypothetical protein BWQ96_01229 [Gracilariopsis chorda]
MPLVVAAGISPPSVQPSAYSTASGNKPTPQSDTNSQPRPAKRKRKRPRTLRGKRRVVLKEEQMPDHRTRSNGKLRNFDMDISTDVPENGESMSRKQREFVMRLQRMKQNAGKPANKPASKRAANKHQLAIKPGETRQQFMDRVGEHNRKQLLQIAREDNRQRLKKRAYYERRLERMERKKKRRRGELSDSDVEHDSAEHVSTAHGVSLSQLPMYWQDIVRNNGRPVSKKKRNRDLKRSEVKFGDQAERPPKLEKVAIRHGKARS